MNGLIAAPGGEVCPAVLPAPFTGIGDDITSNSVVCCVFKLPPHHKHSVQLLPGAEEEVGAAAAVGKAGEWAQGLPLLCGVLLMCGWLAGGWLAGWRLAGWLAGAPPPKPSLLMPADAH
jgi:hypothetical protein